MEAGLIVAVTGSTGTGKTKLGIELAKQYNGEVISADSMQLYRGLDVITNTVTEEEAEGVTHHCVNYVSPGTRYDVKQYLQHTLPIIRDIIGRGKLPVIVGGTVYYIEALLWEFTLSNDLVNQDKTAEERRILNSAELSPYQKLQQLDAETAARLHPNNTRKIERSLEIFREFGARHSQLLAEQHNDQGIRGHVRWDGALIFTLGCDMNVLDARLDRRVDKMLQLGLTEELETFCSLENDNCGLTTQAIGYKEFQDYIHLKNTQCTDSDKLRSALDTGLVKMKETTRRYARKQMRWINNRLHNGNYPNYHIYSLDTSTPETWDTDISLPATTLTNQFLQGTLPSQSVTVASVPSKRLVLRCDICDVLCDCQVSYDAHVASRRHRKRKTALRKTTENEKIELDNDTP